MTWRAAFPDLDTLDSAALRTLILSEHEQILFEREQLSSREAEIEQLKLLIASCGGCCSGASRRRWRGRSSSCSQLRCWRPVGRTKLGRLLDLCA